MDINRILEDNGTRSEMETANAAVADVHDKKIPLPPNDSVLKESDKEEYDLLSRSVEIDSIERDMDNLWCRVNSTIDGSHEKPVCVEVSTNNFAVEGDAIVNIPEKPSGTDGIPEEKLQFNSYPSERNLNEFSIESGSNPAEIDWDAVEAIFQKYQADFQRLNELNQVTSAVLQHIENIAEKPDF